jgi:hypothetical protein
MPLILRTGGTPRVQSPAADEERQPTMDDMNHLAKELADAIAAAVSQDTRVEACREKAREAGFDLRVTLEAVVGFASRTKPGTTRTITTTPRILSRRSTDEMTASDRRFLRSLRIAADQAKEEV